MQVKIVRTLPTPMPPLSRPASGAPAPGPSDQVEAGREAQPFWKGPARTGLTTTVGAASGAALGGLIGQGLLGAAVGGLLGGAAGAYVGCKWKQLHYDLQSKQLHRENREIQKDAEETKARLELEPALMTPLKSTDLRAAREPGHSQRAYDGFDSSRDIVALYSREGSPQEPYRAAEGSGLPPLNQSVMKLNAQLLHEEDLQRFFDALARQVALAIENQRVSDLLAFERGKKAQG